MEIRRISGIQITKVLILAGVITITINIGMLFIPLYGDSSTFDAYVTAMESRQSLIERAEKLNVTVKIPDLF